MGIKISELSPAASAALTDVLPIVSGSETRRLTVAQLANLIVALIVDGSPDALNTLNELAAALGDDPNFATTVLAALSNRLRVDAAQGLTNPQMVQALANIGVEAGAQGDLFYRGSDGLLKRLAKGMAGQLLRQNATGTAPEWAKGFELISEVDASDVAGIFFTDLGAYQNLYLDGYAQYAVDAEFLFLRTSTDNGVSYDNAPGSYRWQKMRVTGTASPSGAQQPSATELEFGATLIGNQSGEGIGFRISLIDFNQPRRMRTIAQVSQSGTTGALWLAQVVGERLSITARDAFSFAGGLGNFAQVTCKLWGVRS